MTETISEPLVITFTEEEHEEPCQPQMDVECNAPAIWLCLHPCGCSHPLCHPHKAGAEAWIRAGLASGEGKLQCGLCQRIYNIHPGNFRPLRAR